MRKLTRLKEYLARARQYMQEKWNRVLPSNELLSDRWEKAKFLGFGEGSSVYDSCMVIGKVEAGKYVWVGPYTLLDGSGGLVIGDYCDISSGVQIYTHESVKRVLTGYKHPIENKPSKIGSCCFIGPMSIIAMGVEIGDCCVIGANSYVTGSFPPNSIIAGTPAKRLGEVVIADDGSINYVYNH